MVIILEVDANPTRTVVTIDRVAHNMFGNIRLRSEDEAHTHTGNDSSTS